MAWVCCNYDGSELIFSKEPERDFKGREWQVKFTEYQDTDFNVIELPEGSIKKLIGKKLTWQDDSVEL